VDPLQFLTDTKLAIVAGKGGVGKTTVTAVLARAARRRGMRVATVELDGKPTLAQIAGEDVTTLHITPAVALQEYLETHGLGRVARRLTSSGVIDVVASATPGIDDIVVLGKIKQLERSGDYDLVVVDGPAAGHAVTMLLAASSLLATVRGGPIRTQATDVAELLADNERCQVLLVTLPETTPINEAVETAFALDERVNVRLGPVVVNAIDSGAALPAELADEGSAMQRAAMFRNARRELHAAECLRLSHEVAMPQVHLPWITGTGLRTADIESMVDQLLGGVDSGRWANV
jgi:arsenite/tail-anchored protein-transporting ATPase